MKYIDFVGITFLVCITTLMLAFGGEPDLMDALIEYLKK